MPVRDSAINVIPTKTYPLNYSRNELLEWVNLMLDTDYGKVEELCSGIAYCCLMNKLFPGTVPIRRIKFHSKLDHEHMYNFKLLQMAFLKVNVERVIPIDKLIQARLKDNLEFLQWFRRFFAVNNMFGLHDISMQNSNSTVGTKSTGLECPKMSKTSANPKISHFLKASLQRKDRELRSIFKHQTARVESKSNATKRIDKFYPTSFNKSSTTINDRHSFSSLSVFGKRSKTVANKDNITASATSQLATSKKVVQQLEKESVQLKNDDDKLVSVISFSQWQSMFGKIFEKAGSLAVSFTTNMLPDISSSTAEVLSEAAQHASGFKLTTKSALDETLKRSDPVYLQQSMQKQPAAYKIRRQTQYVTQEVVYEKNIIRTDSSNCLLKANSSTISEDTESSATNFLRDISPSITNTDDLSIRNTSSFNSGEFGLPSETDTIMNKSKTSMTDLADECFLQSNSCGSETFTLRDFDKFKNCDKIKEYTEINDKMKVSPRTSADKIANNTGIDDKLKESSKTATEKMEKYTGINDKLKESSKTASHHYRNCGLPSETDTIINKSKTSMTDFADELLLQSNSSGSETFTLRDLDELKNCDKIKKYAGIDDKLKESPKTSTDKIKEYTGISDKLKKSPKTATEKIEKYTGIDDELKDSSNTTTHHYQNYEKIKESIFADAEKEMDAAIQNVMDVVFGKDQEVDWENMDIDWENNENKSISCEQQNNVNKSLSYEERKKNPNDNVSLDEIQEMKDESSEMNLKDEFSMNESQGVKIKLKHYFESCLRKKREAILANLKIEYAAKKKESISNTVSPVKLNENAENVENQENNADSVNVNMQKQSKKIETSECVKEMNDLTNSKCDRKCELEIPNLNIL